VQSPQSRLRRKIPFVLAQHIARTYRPPLARAQFADQVIEVAAA
jgi:hypothetical protein